MGTVLPKGPLWCNADSLLTRMASLNRTQFSDLSTRRVEGTFGEETFGYNGTPG